MDGAVFSRILLQFVLTTSSYRRAARADNVFWKTGVPTLNARALLSGNRIRKIGLPDNNTMKNLTFGRLFSVVAALWLRVRVRIKQYQRKLCTWHGQHTSSKTQSQKRHLFLLRQFAKISSWTTAFYSRHLCEWCLVLASSEIGATW